MNAVIRIARWIAAGVVVSCVISTALAQRTQDSLRTRYGVVGGLSFNMHTADFQALPGIANCCSQFSSGSGTGALGGVFVEWPLGRDHLFSLRASYVDHSALLSKQEPYRIVVGGVGQDMVDEHTIDASLASIGLEPAVAYRAFGDLFVMGGVRLGMMMTKTYSQKEQIIEPAGTGTFLDSLGNDSHSRTRNASTGTIPDASELIVQPFLGVRYDLPMNHDATLLLVPEVSYSYSLTNAASGLNWKPNGVRAGVGLAWSPKPDLRTRTYDTVYIRDTIARMVRNLATQQTYLASTDSKDQETTAGNNVHVLTTITEHYRLDIPDLHDIMASVRAFGVDDDGNEQPIASLRVEEFLSTRVHPLLAYVFFDEGDSVIPSRYAAIDNAAAKKFRLEQLFGHQPLEIYHTVLNIIGYRLTQNPKAKLTLTGCNSNQAVETANKALSHARAEAVKKYFMEVWNIAASRIATVARDLPEKPSNPRTPDGQEENRRVEIACDDPDVLDVFVAHDTARTALPPQVRLKLSAASTSGIGDWSVDIMQGTRSLKHYKGTQQLPPSIDWDLANDPASVPRFNEPLQIAIHAVNGKGDRAGDSLALPTDIVTLEQKKARKSGDVVIDRYNLVLFNFGTSDITPAHERTVKMIKGKLQPTSSILVEGYTDRTGSSASNKTLSMNRAQSTAQALGRQDIIVKGLGKDRLLYPNETPEGRFFCRTVQITVRTPVQ